MSAAVPLLLQAELLDALSTAARASPRRRAHHTLHASEADPVQRLFIAIEPDSYVPPHRHLTPGKQETLLVLRGRLGLLTFDDAGAIVGREVLAAGAACFGVQLPLDCWHSVLALQPGTAFFEVKQGPYQPLAATERATWAPAEGSAQAAAYLAWMHERFVLARRAT